MLDNIHYEALGCVSKSNEKKFTQNFIINGLMNYAFYTAAEVSLYASIKGIKVIPHYVLPEVKRSIGLDTWAEVTKWYIEKQNQAILFYIDVCTHYKKIR